MSTKITGKADFRTDINALRAVAVLAVLLFHYKVPLFTGGFAGVDIFFVISGYLMSKIIINAIDKNQFAYWDYFEKRLKRIVPALIFLLICITLASFVLYFPEEFKVNQKNAASSMLFVSNFLYLSNSDYFDPSSDTNLFLHTWSLSVEWQFYLVYPLILLVLHRFLKSRDHLLLFLAGSTLVIFVVTVFLAASNPTSAFYLLPTRSWEMLAGGIAFLTEDRIKAFKWRKLLALTGYALLISCLFFLKTTMTWPGIFTLCPVLATFLIIVSNHNDLRVIENPVVQFIGKISYSLYLWHWPLFVIAQYYGLGTGVQDVVAISFVAVVMAYLSYTYVETIRITNSRPILYTMAGIFTGTLLLSHFTINDVFYKERTLKIEAYARTHAEELDRQFLKDICHVSTYKDYEVSRCLSIAPKKVNILLIGDSHLGQLSQSLRERLGNKNINFLQATASSTLPTLKNYQGKDARVRELMEYIFYDFVPKNAKAIDGVIITGSWAGQGKMKKEKILFSIKETIQYLKNYGINTLVIGQTERYIIPYTTIAARDYEYNTRNAHSYLDEHSFEIDNYLRTHLRQSYVTVINKKQLPKLSVKLEPYMKDNHHVTVYGADLIVDKLIASPVADNFFED